MPSVTDLPLLPPQLKKIKPYLQRARETESKFPVIAYYCCKYAATLGTIVFFYHLRFSLFFFFLIESFEYFLEVLSREVLCCVYGSSMIEKCLRCMDRCSYRDVKYEKRYDTQKCCFSREKRNRDFEEDLRRFEHLNR